MSIVSSVAIYKAHLKKKSLVVFCWLDQVEPDAKSAWANLSLSFPTVNSC